MVFTKSYSILTNEYNILKKQELNHKLAIVEFSLVRASTGPDATASKIPYISIFPAKLCSMHL